MGWNRQEFIAPPCPGCGKPDAARMGSTGWGHDLSCCGEVCGLRVRDALTAMRGDETFKFFTRMEQHAREQINNLQREHLGRLRALVSSPANRGERS